MANPQITQVLNQFGLKNLVGQLFGQLTVVSRGRKLSSGKYTWNCVCSCGKPVEVRHDYLLHTNCPKTHCGCKNKGPSVLHPFEYSVWSMMLKRCEDPTHVAYHHYGGRGIKVCEAWHDFETFRKDMGPRLSRNWSIERKDANVGYEPGNCVWLLKKYQGRNKRNTIRIPHPQTGQLVPAAEVAEYLGISYQAMRARYVSEGTWPTEQPNKPDVIDANTSTATDTDSD